MAELEVEKKKNCKSEHNSQDAYNNHKAGFEVGDGVLLVWESFICHRLFFQAKAVVDEGDLVMGNGDAEDDVVDDESDATMKQAKKLKRAIENLLALTHSDSFGG
ncbi:hypothetical protein V2J09_018831 [Rumex salicifolius]